MKIPSVAKQVIEDAFGPIENLTPKQIWALVKICKNVRLRCRNNNAFNNYFNGIFGTKYSFNTVTKTRPKRFYPGQTEPYPGLEIKNVKTREVVKSSDTNEDEEE